MARVETQRRVLEWAVNRSGKTVNELRKRPQLDKLREWLEGKRHPTLKQLEALSRATFTPLGYLVSSEPPDEFLPIPDYRTLPSKDLARPSPELLRTIYAMQRRQNWMGEYLEDMGQDKLEFVGSCDHTKDDPETVADKLLGILELDRLWARPLSTWSAALRLLKEVMEASGIIVVFNSVVGNNTHRKLNVEEFRGFVLIDEYAPLVFVNSRDSKAAQMFTLAHEMAHIAFGASSIFDLRNLQPSDDPMEKACNSTAAEFLVPGNELLRAWRKVADADNPYNLLAREFKVSELVVARRALDMSLISMDCFMGFYRSYQERIRDDADSGEGGGDFYRVQNYRVGVPFASAVYRAVKEGRLLYSEAYKLTGLRGKTFDEYVKRIHQ